MIFEISGQSLFLLSVSGQAIHTYNMISVQNFYWSLYSNLLQPANMDCYFYYPWGTQNTLCTEVFGQLERRQNYNHVFYSDQEPLDSDTLGPYDLCFRSWDNKFAKVLANSEHSVTKKDICRSRGFLDWYYFYHGFAALDWYRDTQYIDTNHPVHNAFLSLNLAIKNRSYRAAFLARLIEQKVIHNGSISFHGSQEDLLAELHSSESGLSPRGRNLIKRNIDGMCDLPWRLDHVPINGDLSARLGHNEYKLWQNSLWHLVNETVFYEPKLHLTEKVFKPIVTQRPFVLLAAPGNLEYLRRYGFQTFDRWIDESYDHITDHDQRLDAIADEVARFARMSVRELRDIHREMMPVLLYNKQHFFERFPGIIVNELVENFDRCLRIWNNGRLDGREIPRHPDLESVKQKFMR